MPSDKTVGSRSLRTHRVRQAFKALIDAARSNLDHRGR
jgi:hypothetical protein